jgi:hypothetical protein
VAEPDQAQTRQAAQRMVVAHFIVSADVERSRRFYTEVLGGKLVFGPEPTYVAAARPTTSPRSPLRRRASLTGSAASSISGLPTSTPRTPSGALMGRSS